MPTRAAKGSTAAAVRVGSLRTHLVGGSRDSTWPRGGGRRAAHLPPATPPPRYEPLLLLLRSRLGRRISRDLDEVQRELPVQLEQFGGELEVRLDDLLGRRNAVGRGLLGRLVGRFLPGLDVFNDSLLALADAFEDL